MRFMLAVQSGELAPLEAMLRDDAQAWTDGGGKVRAAVRVVEGATAVARMLIGLSQKNPGASIRPVDVNGFPALLVSQPEGHTLMTLELDDERVRRVFAVRNPDKLGFVVERG